jgi:hypothetical protein
VRIVANAVKSFRLEYGYDPLVTNAEKPKSMVAILPILMAISNAPFVVELNPKGIRFLDVPAYRILEGQFLDPWGRPYHITFAKNGTQTTEVGGTIVNSPIAVWSEGRNGKDQAGKGDDISSWKDP